MKKLFSIVFLSFFLQIALFSKQVDSSTAKQVAIQFIKTKTDFNFIPNENEIKLIHTIKSQAKSNISNYLPINYIFIFEINSSGFILVSGDDLSTPILGYSNNSKFDPLDISVNTKKWIESYIGQIRMAIENKLEQDEFVKNQWLELTCNNQLQSVKRRAGGIPPLLKTTWDQLPFYNEQCPFDKQNNKNTVTGCVATAMAQIMKYHNYPISGNGFYSYNHRKYGALSANFGTTTYQWNLMPNGINSSNYPIAILMYHCGISVDMNYGVNESGAQGAPKVVSALKKYFGYSSGTIMKERRNYSDNEWVSLLKQELNSARPIYYEGTGNGSGHGFVCDGYDENDFFHFNWGWGGVADGFYYNINALNPVDKGSGAGYGYYNSNHKVVVGIQKPTVNVDVKIELNNDIVVSDDPLYYGTKFSVTSNFYNSGTSNFEGDFCMAVFDESLTFIDYIEIKSGYNLKSGYTYSNDLIFNTNGIFGMLPGKYFIGAFWRYTNGDWKVVSDYDGYNNMVALTVVNPNDLELYSKITTSPINELVKGQTASVNFNLINDGLNTFKGEYQANLYRLDGTFVQTINTVSENNGLPSSYSYSTPFITLSSNSISAEPGTYLLAIIHRESGSTFWQLTGSTYYQNPIKINVKAPPIVPDKYEINNSVDKAYNLPITFNSNSIKKNTVGSNCHIGSDYDYYKINLPVGYRYSINPRVHDAYSSLDGNDYSLDVIFSYSIDGINWSDAYDDVLNNPISIEGGKSIYFHISPYFQGEEGNYLLDISINRTQISNSSVIEIRDSIIICPNPSNGNFTIINNSKNQKVEEVEITNSQGQTLYIFTNNMEEKEIAFSIKEFSNGLYFVNVKYNNGFVTSRLILNK